MYSKTAFAHPTNHPGHATRVLIAALACATLVSIGNAQRSRHRIKPVVMEFSVAQIFLEEDGTVGDLGIHFKVDGEPWDRVMLFDPFWHKLVDIDVGGSSSVIGLTEIFNESAEPSFDEMPREDLLALFPEGEYRFFGRSVEGAWLFGEAELTHTMPPKPKLVAPVADAQVSAGDPLVIQWEPLQNPTGTEIEAVLVHVAKEVEGERSRYVDIEVGPEQGSVTIAPGFLEAGATYEIEILAEESSGNKIFATSEFETLE